MRHLETGHVRGKLTISVRSAEAADHALQSPETAGMETTPDPGDLEPAPPTGSEAVVPASAGPDDLVTVR